MLTAKDIISRNLTDKQRLNINKIYTALYNSNEPLLKSDICKVIGSKSERQARDYVSAIKKLKPIISYNKMKGFKLAKSEQDVPENERSLFEDLSRVNELLYNCLPRLKFESKHNIEYKHLEESINRFLAVLEEPKIGQYKEELKWE